MLCESAAVSSRKPAFNSLLLLLFKLVFAFMFALELLFVRLAPECIRLGRGESDESDGLEMSDEGDEGDDEEGDMGTSMSCDDDECVTFLPTIIVAVIELGEKGGRGLSSEGDEDKPCGIFIRL